MSRDPFSQSLIRYNNNKAYIAFQIVMIHKRKMFTSNNVTHWNVYEFVL